MPYRKIEDRKTLEHVIIEDALEMVREFCEDCDEPCKETLDCPHVRMPNAGTMMAILRRRCSDLVSVNSRSIQSDGWVQRPPDESLSFAMRVLHAKRDDGIESVTKRNEAHCRAVAEYLYAVSELDVR